MWRVQVRSSGTFVSNLVASLVHVPTRFRRYELAVLKGLNPDVPRNLAKAVTVD